MAELSPWRGLFSNASPHAVPPGGAQVQENLMSMRPGLLEVRRGQYSLMTGDSFTQANTIAKIRRGGRDGLCFANIGGSVSFMWVDATGAAVPIAYPTMPCVCQSRQGDVIVIGGGGRGKIALYNGTTVDLGITPPVSGPAVVASAGTGGYAESTYYFGYRWGDALGRWSSLSPLTEVTITDASQFTITTAASSEERVTKTEIYRSLADDPNDLFLVESFDNGGIQIATDTTEDSDLVLNTACPITLDDGTLFARRHDVPPTNATIIVPLQDRWFYFGQGTPDDATRNTIYWSEVDLPESVPAGQNNIVLADDYGDPDDMIAGFAHNGVLYLGKRRRLYQLTFSSDPKVDAAVQVAHNRGILNQRCFTTYRDSVFILDDTGPWRMGDQGDFDGPVHNYWTDGVIDFTQSSKFFVCAEPTEQVIRYFVILKGYGWNYPKMALCYGIATNNWWTETYRDEYYGAAVFPYQGRQRTVVASSSGLKLLSEGVGDLTASLAEASISYRYKTGAIPIPPPHEKGKQAASVEHYLSIAYEPIDSIYDEPEEVTIRVYFDHDATPISIQGGYQQGRLRANHGGDGLVLNLKRNPDSFGSTGVERVNIPVGSQGVAYKHKFVTIELQGTQNRMAHKFYSLDFN